MVFYIAPLQETGGGGGGGLRGSVGLAVLQEAENSGDCCEHGAHALKVEGVVVVGAVVLLELHPKDRQANDVCRNCKRKYRCQLRVCRFSNNLPCTSHNTPHNVYCEHRDISAVHNSHSSNICENM